MNKNHEVITGGDFKRMVAGAYSEFLLEYEKINKLTGDGELPGTHILHTMGSAVMPLADVKDESLGGLARRVATAAVFGARGNAGVVLAQLFRGLGKGLAGKYYASSSEFGKAFQYGILYAQRIIPETPERPFITAAKAVAKGAYHAVRANDTITEILSAAKNAGEESLTLLKTEDAGALIMTTFLTGCLKGLDGNFVSPAVSLSLGLTSKQDNLPDPRNDVVKPYCVTLTVKNSTLHVPSLEKQLKEYGSFALVEKENKGVHIHIHTDHVGNVIEQMVGWGPLRDVRVTNMSETHALGVHNAIMQVAPLAVAADKKEADLLQEAGASIIVGGSPKLCPSVAELVGAAHSDMAAAYVMVAAYEDYHLVFKEAKRLLGNRVELVLCKNFDEEIKALQAFDIDLKAADNARRMKNAADGKLEESGEVYFEDI